MLSRYSAGKHRGIFHIARDTLMITKTRDPSTLSEATSASLRCCVYGALMVIQYLGERE